MAARRLLPDKLEAWAAHHPTLAALRAERHHALEDVEMRLGLKLWHEVFVLPARGQHFEYVNCYAGIGLLS